MSTQTMTQKAAETAVVVRDDLRDIVRGRSFEEPNLDERGRKALADLRRDGFAVVPGYWPREEALVWRDRLEAHLEREQDHDFESGAYLRVWDNRAYDQGVRRLYHVDREHPELREFRFDPFVLDIASAYYRVPFHSGLLAFQHNTQSNDETRYYHVDGFAKEFKSFMYLDDVTRGNGPFTYLRGTHRDHLRRLRKQIVGNREGSPTSFSPEDLSKSLEDEVMIEGQAGTLILADVRGFHRGSPQQDGSRSILMNYVLRHSGDFEPDR